MQQALFSPGPRSCPAWAPPRVMALVRLLLCLCLDTLVRISEGARRAVMGSEDREPALPLHTAQARQTRGVTTLQGGFAGRKWSLGTTALLLIWVEKG